MKTIKVEAPATPAATMREELVKLAERKLRGRVGGRRLPPEVKRALGVGRRAIAEQLVDGTLRRLARIKIRTGGQT